MTARLYLRTHDLALAGHISVQQVRNMALFSPLLKCVSERSPYDG